MKAKSGGCGKLALLGGIALAALACEARARETYDLRSRRTAGDIDRVDVSLEVGGNLKVVEEGHSRNLKMSVVGKLSYDEKLLSGGDRPGLLNGVRAARLYRDAEAVIKIDKGGATPKLRDQRRLIVADVGQPEALLYCPHGPLTREELDLIDVPGNSALLDYLLPASRVGIGDRWQHPDQLVAGLLGLDAVSETDTASELEAIEGDTARLTLRGAVQGAAGGVATEIELKGRYEFSLDEHRVSRFALLIKENRSVGHVATGLDVVAKLQMTVQSGAKNPKLTDKVLAGTELKPEPQAIELEYTAPNSKFRFTYDRRWHVIQETEDGVALRLVDRGELIAQCNVSPLADVAPGSRTSLERFQADIEKALDKNFGGFLQATEATMPQGYHLCRVVAEGKVSELPIQWNYYLVADAAGHQIVFAFVVEGDLLERLADADAQVVAGLEFIGEATAGEPTPAAAPRKARLKSSRQQR